MTAKSRSRHVVPHRTVSEAVREREMLRHWLPFQASQEGQDFQQRVSSANVILTALAQLGIYHVGAERAFVSLFDSKKQYFVAEATSGTYLRPSAPNHEQDQPLRLCGTAAPRGDDACEYTLLNQAGDDPEYGGCVQLPVTVVPDLASDTKFSACAPSTAELSCARFYAAVPIRTKRGINVGVYSVVNTSTRPWTDLNAERLRDISSAISDHLETEGLRAANRRNARMNRGVGSFLEGSSTLSGWRFGSNTTAFTDVVGSSEGSLNQAQQSLQLDSEDTAFGKPQPSYDALPAQHDRIRGPLDRAGKASDTILENQALGNVFSRVANIVRESVEVEGCLFLDPSMPSYETHKTRTSDLTASASSSSSDDSTQRQAEDNGSLCDIAGISTSAMSSIDRARQPETSVSLSKKFIRKMSKRYPQGKIFNFGDDGELQTSDSSCDEMRSSISASTNVAPPKSQEAPFPSIRSATHIKPASRQRDGKIISAAFPGARSVAFFPVWHPRQERWCASGLIYTNSPTRAFTVEGELSYLRAFGMLAAAELVRLEALQAVKAKSDALGSLSHELRSPLHGVLLSTELLADTDLNVFQSNIAHTIETCSRTLLDTMDNLLDYSKVNNLSDNKKNVIGGRQPGYPSAPASSGFLKKNLVNDCSVDELVEEVVESVFAGFNFQHKSIKQHVSQHLPRGSSSHADDVANSASDYLGAMDQLNSGTSDSPLSQFRFGNVTVILSLDANCDWLFRFQVGAVRRIVMNLVGNALKYTHKGTVTVSLMQQTASIRRRKPEQVIRFTVEDTGKGISESYLNGGLFTPFSQEDDMAPGTGIGLSLAKQIVSRLRGQISINSQVDVGTFVTVLLPLDRSKISETALQLTDPQAQFDEQVRNMAGLRVRVMSKSVHGLVPTLDLHNSLGRICREWLKLEVLHDEDYSRQPDVVLWTQDTFAAMSKNMNALAYAPNIVICPDALAAHQKTKESDIAGWRGVFEFVSQPIGPRKLAKILALACSRWTIYEGAHPSSLAGSTVGPRPREPDHNSSNSSWLQIAPSCTGCASPGSQRDSSVPVETRGNAPGEVPTHPPQSDRTAVSPPEETTGKFLLVDDNHINLKILSTYMKKLHLPYHTATNGKQAVDQYMESPQSYICILLDISMPVMNGFEAARQIREFENRQGIDKGVVIFALSGLASEEAQREAYESGFDLFLLKPVKLQVLGETLQQNGVLNLLDGI
ncbi:Ff.00g100490.m01.CDS01 [Fusarium sp. VM40]|nr:Ff.00g100490.m01.CDS01 [Fusarium sp. VM40]